MAGLMTNGDSFINQYVLAHDASQLKDNVVAVDATYYLYLMLHKEPLVAALGGMLAAEKTVNDDLDKWKTNNTIPFFIFDGCPVKGEDDLAVKMGREANVGTDGAWNLYSSGDAINAVNGFGKYTGAYQPQSLYPLLQGILRKRGLHFLVPPFKAVAQIAYFSKTETMCGAIMGSRELLLYPIKDVLIQEIDWDNKKFKAVNRDVLMTQLGVDESIFVDALLITGCSFLAPFPARAQPQHTSNSVRDAVNMLRANGKHVKQLCSSFDDVLKEQQPDWFDGFRKARMIVKHFIYISVEGAVLVENNDEMTSDSHEFHGIRLPDELLHYLNTGLIGPHVLSWIIHSRVMVRPTLDGIASEEYRDLVLKQLLPSREMALGLVVPRLNRGVHFKDIEVRAWFADQSSTIRNSSFRTPSPKVATWDVEEKVVSKHFPAWSLTASASKDRAGSVAFEVLSLQKPEFAKDTVSRSGSKVKTESPHHLISSVIWRFLHLRDYISDSHELTSWGKALATAMTELEPTVKQNPKVPGLYEALLLAFELIRLDQLNSKPRPDELANGEVDPSLLLVSRCAVLLKLRHEPIGYTGPLRKDMLAYLAQVSAVREADRDLVEAIVASLFLNNKANRDLKPGESWDIGNALPFVNRNYNAAMGVAIRTYLDQKSNEDNEYRDVETISVNYFPKATNFEEDINIFVAFFNALVNGVKTLDQKDLDNKDVWTKADEYLRALA